LPRKQKQGGWRWWGVGLLGLGLLLTGPAALTRPVVAAPPAPRPEMVTAETERAIKKGLEFLTRTQSRDGSWRNTGGWGAFPTCMTSLAGLSLLASGSTPVEGEHAPSVRKAVDFVVSCATPSGVISAMEEESRPMHSHGFAMLFLGQAYGMERDELRRDKIRKVLQKAVELTGRAQSPDGGWLYTPDANSDEGSVTVCEIQGLRSIRNAGIYVPKNIIDKAVKYVELSQNPDGGIRYTARMGGESRPAISAAAVATLYNAGQFDHPAAKKCLDYIRNLFQRTGGTQAMYQGHEFYGMFYTAQAMYLAGERDWKTFFPTIREDLIRRQAGDGSWTGDGVGTTYGTAIALTILQLPYKYLPILQR